MPMRCAQLTPLEAGPFPERAYTDFVLKAIAALIMNLKEGEKQRGKNELCIKPDEISSAH